MLGSFKFEFNLLSLNLKLSYTSFKFILKLVGDYLTGVIAKGISPLNKFANLFNLDYKAKLNGMLLHTKKIKGENKNDKNEIKKDD